MEAEYIADRAALRCLARHHPEWTHGPLAACLGRSVSFVKKWLKRLREADPEDLQVLFSRSRARHTPPPDPSIVERILTMCARRVRGRASNVSGRYPSVKMGRSIQFESQHVELWAI